jgi:ribosomal protein S27AE
LAGHGPEWRRWCRIVGIEPRRCFDNSNTQTVALRWLRYCPKCGNSQQIARRSKKRYACGKCAPVWDEALVLRYKPNPAFAG